MKKQVSPTPVSSAEIVPAPFRTEISTERRVTFQLQGQGCVFPA